MAGATMGQDRVAVQAGAAFSFREMSFTAACKGRGLRPDGRRAQKQRETRLVARKRYERRRCRRPGCSHPDEQA